MSDHANMRASSPASCPQGACVLGPGCGDGALGFDLLQRTRGCTGYGIERDRRTPTCSPACAAA